MSHKDMDRLAQDLENAQWRKSSRSSTNGEACVEIAITEEAVGVRDSKNTTGPVLVFTRAEWDAFMEAARGGEFDS